AADLAPDDVDVAICNDFPVGAGLGGSSAAGVAVAAAIAAWRSGHGAAVALDRVQLAEESRRREVEELGVAGGRQDHYAAALGGALALTFGATTEARRIPLTDEGAAEIERRCVVAYSGESRISGATIDAVIGAYARGEQRVLDELAAMKALAREMADALAHADLDRLGALVGSHWRHQRALHPSIPTARIDEILARGAAAGALGGKALGASGGGCVVLVAGEGREDAVRAAVAPLADLLEFRIDHAGVIVEEAIA
ncbi:MAG TPA: hypothetical protein VFX50_17440, partial [Gemmatimonadales bacterium]|nr:hypothetical protein [Gemmatimonadales bacterium]